MHVGGGDEPLPRVKRAAACLLFASRTPMGDIERNLMQHLRDPSVAGPVRAVAARTRDVIGTVALVASVRGVQTTDDAVVDDMSLMLELGLPRELVPVARVLGATLNRAQYLTLVEAGLVDVHQVKRAEPELLTRLLGETSAAALHARLSETRDVD